MNEQSVEYGAVHQLAAARDTLTPAIETVIAQLDGAGLSDRELLGALRIGGQLARLSDALLVAATEQVHAGNDAPRDERLTTRLGARDAGELLRAATLCDGRTARALERAARLTRRERSLTSGQLLPGRFPRLSAALREGAISAAAFLAATGPLHAAAARIPTEVMDEADAILAAAARGHGANTTNPDPDPANANANANANADADADADDDGGAGRGVPIPPLDAEDLKYLARRLAAYADPDGAEPTEQAAMRRRSLSLGPAKDGLVPIRGNLLPEVASQLERLLSAITNPRSNTDTNPDHTNTGTNTGTNTDTDTDTDTDTGTGTDSDSDSDSTLPGTGLGHAGGDHASAGGATGHGTDRAYGADGAAATGARVRGDASSDEDELLPPPDERTGAQKRHDAFAALLGLAARAADAPTIGGAAPTLVLTMTEDDYLNQTGWAHLDGIDAPTSARAARHAACTGSIQRITHDDHGRIIAIQTHERVFNAAQRRAITARDRECIIPGCHTPAAWCEIHHVLEWARGGRTTTDNGVLLCWFHHRTLAINGWTIRMLNGTPHIRGPQWWDPHQRWHTTHTTLARAG